MSNYAYTKQKLRWKGGQWGSRPLTGGGVSQDTKKSLKADTYIRPIRRVKTACLYGPYVRVSKNAPTHTAGMYGPYVRVVCIGLYFPKFKQVT